MISDQQITRKAGESAEYLAKFVRFIRLIKIFFFNFYIEKNNQLLLRGIWTATNFPDSPVQCYIAQSKTFLREFRILFNSHDIAQHVTQHPESTILSQPDGKYFNRYARRYAENSLSSSFSSSIFIISHQHISLKNTLRNAFRRRLRKNNFPLVFNRATRFRDVITKNNFFFILC